MKTPHLETIVELAPVVVSVQEDTPRILVGSGTQELSLLTTFPHIDKETSLEKALREWVKDKSGISLGHIEQLYTFGNKGRFPEREALGEHVITITYLGLTKDTPASPDALWAAVYDFLPWEDWREGEPKTLRNNIAPNLKAWVAKSESDSQRLERKARINIAFGITSSSSTASWNSERALERYELLYEAKLLGETVIGSKKSLITGTPMSADHRRIVASALSRLRGKIRYRPVVFELLPPTFTLFHLQTVVEALRGQRLHKQNFRRLIESEGLVEPVGSMARTKGRPAELYRFRKAVLQERPSPGIRLGIKT